MSGLGFDLKQLVKSVSRADQIVKPRYEQWLLKDEALPMPAEVADQLHAVMIKAPRDRSHSFSASSSGSCERAQIYGYLGVPASQLPGHQLAAILLNGTFTHLRLQASLLMAGVIDRIEIPVKWRKMRTKGTVDGAGVVPADHPHVLWRGMHFGLELKTAHPRVFAALKDEVMQPAGPAKYVRQYTRYFQLGGFDLFSVFVEDKSTQDTLEFVVEPNDQMLADDKQELVDLNWAVDNRRLPNRLPECRHLSGETFRNCPYGGRHGPCARLTSYREAERKGKE